MERVDNGGCGVRAGWRGRCDGFAGGAHMVTEIFGDMTGRTRIAINVGGLVLGHSAFLLI
jgi:hypothetical protein